ncbi:MAG: putative lipid II flippase FtsW [Cardiobacteriaceae bacterium]|nr:putative lipid II flippase FtsW [Cardiobacteriaceae bacterium]
MPLGTPLSSRSTVKSDQHIHEFHKSQKQGTQRWQGLEFPDVWLLFAWLALIAIGIVMVTSASMSEAVGHNSDMYYYTTRQAVFYVFGLFAAYVCYSLPTHFFYQNSGRFLIISLLLLFAIYLPWIGFSVNGARRWLNLRLFNLQVGEVVKLSMIIYAAAFLQRNNHFLDRSWKPIFELLCITSLFAVILVKQPDFGTTMVMVATVLGMMFMAGVNGKRFALFFVAVSIAMVAVLVAAPYRVKRLMTFLHPWEHQYDEGYQLVNSLIAIGSGGLFGSGLGQSVQKHDYLPEAHTDFIFSIIAEEFGLLGALVVIGLFVLLVWRAFAIGCLADRVRKRFASLLAYGIGLLIAIQAAVNIGVTTGSLPTKGLTLPLVSYGGSSVVIVCISLGILARIDAESRFQARREGLI